MSAQPVPRLTVEQYLELERASDTKHDYYDGQMYETYAMAGGSLRHSLLIANLTMLVAQALKDTRCLVTTADLLVRTSPQGLHTYPDLAVICSEPSLADGHRDILLNPTVVFEVLSPSTEGYDRGLKSAEYRRIESLKEYVLVSQTEPRVEVFSRGSEGEWILRDFNGMDAVCRVTSIDVEIPLAEIYRKVPLEKASG